MCGLFCGCLIRYKHTMKIVCQCSELVEAERIKNLLEDKGIPANITGQEAYHLQLAALVSRPLAVWVYLDEQVDDAKTCLDNPEHLVHNALNIENFYKELQKNIDSQSISGFNRQLIVSGLSIILLLIICIAVLLKL
jgi:hypothetical protein